MRRSVFKISNMNEEAQSPKLELSNEKLLGFSPLYCQYTSLHLSFLATFHQGKVSNLCQFSLFSTFLSPRLRWKYTPRPSGEQNESTICADMISVVGVCTVGCVFDRGYAIYTYHMQHMYFHTSFCILSKIVICAFHA